MSALPNVCIIGAGSSGIAGAKVSPFYLADFTITSRRLIPNCDVQFGMRNSFNRNYSDPIALTVEAHANTFRIAAQSLARSRNCN